MPLRRDQLPCPPLNIAITVPPPGVAPDAPSGAVDQGIFGALPSKPGVLAIEDEGGVTLTLVSTANLRRAALVRLGPQPEGHLRSRRLDLRGLARRVRAVTVGSAFEADWAYLQLARRHLPHSYRSAVDRWQAWFIHCDPKQPFPQWVKTAHPGSAPTGASGTYVGPFSDKHAAARFIEMLEDAFDLCRYHHILVQAPQASACAYKEMGKCPAPCDGSIAMEQYSSMVEASIGFAREPAPHRALLEADMRRHSAAMEFEAALQCKSKLERTAKAERHEFSRVADFAAFEYIAVAPSERRGWARLFMISGGWITPVSDVGLAAHPDVWVTLTQQLAREAWRPSPDFSRAALENIGMVCRHLLLPRSAEKPGRAVFLHQSTLSDTRVLARTIAGFTKEATAAPTEDDGDAGSELVETELEGL